MSMPSSSALVDTTARTRALAQPLLDLAAPLRQVAAAIAADLVAARRAAPAKSSLRYVVRISVASRLCAKTISCSLRFRNSRRDAPRLRQIRPADAELLVDHRRVDEEEHLLAARRAGLRHQLERLLDQRLGQLARVGDRGRRADERGIRPVVPADAAQPPQHVGEVAAEDAAIGVQLVDDDEAQVLEQLRPARMVRQDARVQHVGVAEHHVRAAADGAARVLRRVAVVGEHADLELVGPRQPVRQLVQLGQLVLRQRLGRKQIQRARRRVAQDAAAAPARCSRASCPRRSAWSPPRGGRRGRARRLRPDACRAARCRGPAAPSRSRSSTASGNGANTAGAAG